MILHTQEVCELMIVLSFLSCIVMGFCQIFIVNCVKFILQKTRRDLKNLCFPFLCDFEFANLVVVRNRHFCLNIGPL